MKKLIFFGLVSFLLAAIWLTPLAFVLPYINKLSNEVRLVDAEGTIWNGKVQQLVHNNQNLGKASWKVDPLKSITSFSLKTRFNLKGNDIDTFGIAGLSASKEIQLTDTQFDVNARYINTLQKNAKLSGNFKGFIKKAKINQGEVPSFDAIVNWQNGALETPIKLSEGDYRAVIKPEGENLDIKLSSKEAPIELNGDIKLQNDWVFNTNITTKSQNTGLMTMMKFAGKPQADGSILIQKKGDLKPFVGIN